VFGGRMEFVKAKEILKVIQGLDSESNKTILEALKIAEHIEKMSKEIYEKEAIKTKGSELEKFFVFLVKEEEMHLKKILELEENIDEKDFEKVSFPKNVAPEMHNIQVGQNELTTILYSLWREKKAVEFYSSAAEKTKGKVRLFFNELADFEKEHVVLFEGLVEGTQNVRELIMG
jgi:rubrerythrin